MNGRFLPLFLLLGFTGFLNAMNLRDSQPVAPVQNPPRDYHLVIHGIGAWRGNFNIDERGRGGLPALHAFSQKRRRALEARGDGLILVQSGNFTGRFKNPADFREKLLPPRLNLIEYMNFDGVSFSPQENAYLLDKIDHPELKNIPALSFNFRPALLLKGRSSPVSPLRILRRGKLNILLTSLTRGKAPYYELNSTDRLIYEFNKRQGPDLGIILLTGLETHPEYEEDHSAGPTHARLVNSPAETIQGSRVGTREQTPRQILRQIFETARIDNPYDELKLKSPYSLAIIGGAPRNKIYRLLNGTFVCAVKGRNLCEVELVFRERRLISWKGRFIDLNGINQPRAWIVPDANLKDALREARELRLRKQKKDFHKDIHKSTHKET